MSPVVARNENNSAVVPMVESAFGKSVESGSWFCIDDFGKNMASVAVKMCSHLI